MNSQSHSNVVLQTKIAVAFSLCGGGDQRIPIENYAWLKPEIEKRNQIIEACEILRRFPLTKLHVNTVDLRLELRAALNRLWNSLDIDRVNHISMSDTVITRIISFVRRLFFVPLAKEFKDELNDLCLRFADGLIISIVTEKSLNAYQIQARRRLLLTSLITGRNLYENYYGFCNFDFALSEILLSNVEIIAKAFGGKEEVDANIADNVYIILEVLSEIVNNWCELTVPENKFYAPSDSPIVLEMFNKFNKDLVDFEISSNTQPLFSLFVLSIRANLETIIERIKTSAV